MTIEEQFKQIQKDAEEGIGPSGITWRLCPRRVGNLKEWTRNPRQISDKQGKVGHVVRLRFHLHRATLYAFQVGEEESSPPYV